MQLFSSLQALQDRQAFTRHLDLVRDVEWVVYAKPPFAGPQQVVDYVGRYTHRVAISNNRIVDIEDGRVKFNWKDYRNNNQQKTMTLSADEFIRRFLLHVLPSGFHRIRYYGFLGNRHRKERCRQLLGMAPPKEKHYSVLDFLTSSAFTGTHVVCEAEIRGSTSALVCSR